MEGIRKSGEQIVRFWRQSGGSEDDCLASGIDDDKLNDVVITNDLFANEGAPTFWTVIHDGDNVFVLSDNDKYLTADQETKRVFLSDDEITLWVLEEAKHRFPYVYLALASSTSDFGQKLYLSPGDDNTVSLRSERDATNQWLYHIFGHRNVSSLDDLNTREIIRQETTIHQIGQQIIYYTTGESSGGENVLDSVRVGDNYNGPGGTQNIGDVTITTEIGEHKGEIVNYF